jgi:hypothetical protein
VQAWTGRATDAADQEKADTKKEKAKPAVAAAA